MTVAHNRAGSGQSAESWRLWSHNSPLTPELGSAFYFSLGLLAESCVCVPVPVHVRVHV